MITPYSAARVRDNFCAGRNGIECAVQKIQLIGRHPVFATFCPLAKLRSLVEAACLTCACAGTRQSAHKIRCCGSMNRSFDGQFVLGKVEHTLLHAVL